MKHDPEKEARIKHVTDKIDKKNEARGHALNIIGSYRRAQMTPEEIAEQVEKDNFFLFGPPMEEK